MCYRNLIVKCAEFEVKNAYNLSSNFLTFRRDQFFCLQRFERDSQQFCPLAVACHAIDLCAGKGQGELGRK